MDPHRAAAPDRRRVWRAGPRAALARWVPAAGLREAMLVAGLYLTYSASRLVAADATRPALLRARHLLDLEHHLDLDHEHVVNHFAVAHPGVGLLSSYWYSTAHYLATPLVLAWLFLRHRHGYLQARRALLVATALGLALYLTFPTAPPRLLAGYTDVLALHADLGWWGADASAPRGLGGLTNQLAAFPSLHAGWALWVALSLRRWTRATWLRSAGWLHAGLTALVVIVTGNHWILDVVAGWLITLIA